MSNKWFNPTTVLSRSQVLRRAAKERDRNAPVPVIRGVKLVDMDSWPYPRAGVTINYMGKDEVFYTTRDLMKIFDIDKATVYKWQKVGLLPKPFFTRENKYNKHTKYYIRPQLVAASKIVNDLRRQGLLRFTKSKIKHHIAMLEEGNELAIRNWQEQRDRKELKNLRKGKRIRWMER